MATVIQRKYEFKKKPNYLFRQRFNRTTLRRQQKKGNTKRIGIFYLNAEKIIPSSVLETLEEEKFVVDFYSEVYYF